MVTFEVIHAAADSSSRKSLISISLRPYDYHPLVDGNTDSHITQSTQSHGSPTENRDHELRPGSIDDIYQGDAV